MEDDNTKENEVQNQEEIKEEKEKIEDTINEGNQNEQKEEIQNETIQEVPKENEEENQKENIEEKQEDAQNDKNEEEIKEVPNEQKEENQNEVEKKEEIEKKQKENTEEVQIEQIEEKQKENIEEKQKENIEEIQNEQKEEIQNEQIEEIQNEKIEIIQEVKNEENQIENIEEIQNEQNEENQKDNIDNIQEVQNEKIEENIKVEYQNGKLEEIQNEEKIENQIQNEKFEQNINEVNQNENVITIGEEKIEENKIEIKEIQIEKIDEKQNENIQLNKNENNEVSKTEIKENKNEIKETQNKVKKKKIQMFGDIKIESKKNNSDNDTKKINVDNNENIPKPVIEHIETSEDKKLNSKKIYIDKTSELNGKTLYHIKGDYIPDNAQVIRRYRDFDLLCIKLNHNWPCIFLPPISKKKLFSNTDKKVIDERVYQLQNFLQISSELPFIAQSPEYKLFLNKDITNSDTFQAQMKRLAPYNYKTISENYTKYFSGYKPEKKDQLNDDKFSMMMGYINGFIDRISEYKKQLVVFGDIPKMKIYRDSRLIKHFIDFEKRAMAYFVDKDLSFLYFYNNNASLKDSQEKFIKLINHPFLLLSMWIRLKEIELLSMKEKLNEYKELVSKKNSYNNKVRELQQKLDEAKSGKVGFLDKIFVKGNVKEKYETELKFQTTETEYINNIVQIISDYLSVEFYKYFKDLTQNFYYIVRNFFSTQRENSNIAMDLWLTIKNERDDIPEKINEIVDVEEKEDEKEKTDDKNIEINENNEIDENNENNEINENNDN